MSSPDIPTWVRQACMRWGEQKRRIWAGRDWFGNIDGYAQSLLGRIRSERDGASQGQRNQHWPEVFLAEGLEVQRATKRMQERPYAALHFKYVWDPRWEVSAARKARMLNVSRTAYFEVVGKGESCILQALEGSPDSQVADRVHEIIREALSKHGPKAIRAHTCRSSLDFSPLERPILNR